MPIHTFRKKAYSLSLC